jgi:hypothetical protein
VTKEDIDARKPELDDDGDGHPKDTDCDDDNANTYPGADEVWYDAVDQDCGLDDDFDADKDGFVPDEYFGLTTDGVKGTGFLSGGDCNDQDSDVNPTSVDAWYDGIDTDCQGNDDYDADGDGWVPRTVIYGPTLYAEGTGELGVGDCDDDELLVNPGVDDDWYDGIDSDCQGDDDYDADGDGHYRQGAVYSATKYALETTGTLPGGDCDDTVAEVNPSAEEVWYDGVDADCAGNDDYDADMDGYYKYDEDYGPTTYVDGSGELLGGDCNDDPAADGAAANPGTLEILLDGADHDCDALDGGYGAHSFRMNEITGTTFVGVKGFRLGESNTHIWMSVVADAISAPGREVVESAWGYRIDASDPGGAAPEQNFIYSATDTSAYEPIPGMDLFVDDELVLAALGFLAPDATSGPKRFVHVAGPTPGVVKSSLAMTAFFNRPTPWPEFAEFHLTRTSSDGSLHLVGCDANSDGAILNYAYATRDSMVLDIDGTTGTWSYVTNFESFSASRCAPHALDTGVTVYSNQDGFFHAHTIDPVAQTLTEITLPTGDGGGDTGGSDTGGGGEATIVALLQPIDIVVPGRASSGWAIILDGASGDIYSMRPDYSLAATVSPDGAATQISAVFSPDGSTLYIAFLLDTGQAYITWGDPESGFTEPIPVFSTFSIMEIAIWIDATTADHLILGAAGLGDEVAYGIARVNGD